MQNLWSQKYQRLPTLVKVIIYLVGNYAFIFLTFLAGPLGEMAVNILLCFTVILFTKFILTLEGRNLDAIGWRPMNTKHWKQLISGTCIGMTMLIGVALILKWQTGFNWESTPITFIAIIILFITVLASAYVQELAFRGYPFQILLSKYGVWPAQIIIAIFFGLMHLSSNMSLSDVLSTMFTTGIGSLLFALAYLKTKNLALPTGIHFGWNFLQVLIPRHPSQNGKGIVKIVEGSFDASKLNVWTWVLPYALIMLVVGMLIWFGKFDTKKEHSISES